MDPDLGVASNVEDCIFGEMPQQQIGVGSGYAGKCLRADGVQVSNGTVSFNVPPIFVLNGNYDVMPGYY